MQTAGGGARRFLPAMETDEGLYSSGHLALRARPAAARTWETVKETRSKNVLKLGSIRFCSGKHMCLPDEPEQNFQNSFRHEPDLGIKTKKIKDREPATKAFAGTENLPEEVKPEQEAKETDTRHSAHPSRSPPAEQETWTGNVPMC